MSQSYDQAPHWSDILLSVKEDENVKGDEVAAAFTINNIKNQKSLLQKEVAISIKGNAI